MFTVTESACAHLSTLLAEAPNDAVVRLSANNDSLSMYLGNEQQGDETYEHEGRVVLAVESDLVGKLDNTRIDVEQTEEGPQLVLAPTKT